MSLYYRVISTGHDPSRGPGVRPFSHLARRHRSPRDDPGAPGERPAPRRAGELWGRAGRGSRLGLSGWGQALVIGAGAVLLALLFACAAFGGGSLGYRGGAGAGMALLFGPLLMGLLAVLDLSAIERSRAWRRRRLPPAWLRPGRRVAGEVRCAYCHTRASEAPLLCRDCGASYHARCAEELQACASLGCAHARRRGAGPERSARCA